MGLAHYEPEVDVFDLGGVTKNTITIRGLNVVDLTALLAPRLDLVERAVKLYQDLGSNIGDRGSLLNLVAQITVESPMLLAEVISIACDEPDMAAQAARIPLSVQTDILAKIAKLTFTEVGGLGNLYAVLAEQVRMMRASATLSPGSQK